jgi:hypothetical protein
MTTTRSGTELDWIKLIQSNCGKLEQILECLLAGQDQMMECLEAKIEANQETVEAKMNVGQEQMLARTDIFGEKSNKMIAAWKTFLEKSEIKIKTGLE